MARSSHRLERINAIIKEVLSEIVLNEVKDPRVGLVTIVGVRVAPDLSSAKVFFSVMGDEEQRAITTKVLRGASGYMRHVIADQIDVRTAPELHWTYDDSLDRAFRIAEILKETGTTGDAVADDDEEEKEPEAT
jgi:ribosome-binding factor A